MEFHKHPEEMIAPIVAATVGVERAPEVFEKVRNPDKIYFSQSIQEQ